MARGLQGDVCRHVRTLFNAGVIANLTDGELLERFAFGPGEDAEGAFEAVVERHGPMVLRICRTILRNEHDAEDAFQATFLVLARRASSIRNRASAASWLQGVARRVACCARLAAARRRQHERRAGDRADRSAAEPQWDDLALVLQDAIEQLPERYREPIVLCDMEGLTEGQAARPLGRPVGTIRTQITRGRERLRRQLVRRGVGPEGGVSGVPLGVARAQVVVRAALVKLTTMSAMRFAIARPIPAEIVSAAAAALAEEFMRATLMARLKFTAMTAFAAIGIATAGAVAVGQQGEKPARASDPNQELLDLLRASDKALAQSDAATIDRIYAYEMVGTDHGGSLWNKSRYLDAVKVNAFRIESCESKDVNVQIYGDAAVITYRLSTNTNSKQDPRPDQRVTSTWIRRHGSWQCVAWQTMALGAIGRELDSRVCSQIETTIVPADARLLRDSKPAPAPLPQPDPR